MRRGNLFGSPFSPGLGGAPRRIPIRGLGQGCIEPSPDGSGGCRDVIPCPKGPAVSNNPDGAAAPGQGRRYTLVDYKDGSLIKDDVGDEIWNQYSVTSLPDAWVCQDPRCAPYCGEQPAPPPPPPPPEPAPAPAPEPAPVPPRPAPAPPPIEQPPITVIIPPPRPQPSPCDASAWLRKIPAGPVLGRVRLMPGRF